MSELFQARLGHTFNDPLLLQKALTHSSYFYENRALSAGHYERLEFLGDAVLGLVTSEALMKAYPQVEEGTLSKWRASLVNETTLTEVAVSLDLAQFVFLGKSESRDRLRPRLLSSALEAVLGAVYLDGGLEKVRTLIEQQLASRIEILDMQVEFAADFKTRLQELTQRRFRVVPEYRLVEAVGPDHAKLFTYEVYVNDKCLGRGVGNSRKSAEQDAAQDALNHEGEK
jgi:ribonuclease-3